MHRRSFLLKSGAAGLIACLDPGKLFGGASDMSATDLETRFLEPALSDHPMVYWFWMNGHVTKEGITLDLEAMKRVGIGGVFNFDAGISIPKGPVEYFSAEWLELKRHAITEAARLGLEFVLHNCPGWSASGGPWITPERAMQQITWSEVVLQGDQQAPAQLPLPFHKLNFYRDVAVLAYPSLPSEKALQDYRASTDNGPVDKVLVTGEKSGGVLIQPASKTVPGWLLLAFADPHTVQALSFQVTAMDVNGNEEGRTAVELQSSDDGVAFTSVVTISTGLAAELRAGYKFITYDIPPIKAKYFRFLSTQPRRFSQVRFSGYTRLQNFLEKTGARFQFSGETTSPIYSADAQPVPADSMIDMESVIDLTEHLDEGGNLHWNAPPGSWTVLRFGYTATGAVNKAAPENGTGLESDKFSASATDFHFNNMLAHLGPMLKEVADMCKTGLLIDSYEAGPQTWTKAFPEEFQKRRGYAITRYLPALTGRILNSMEYTEQVLWDFRRTQADLIADHYYGRLAERCRQEGFTAYAEPYDKGPFEEMQAGPRVDVSMGEFWYGLHSLLQGNRAVERTSKLAASIMHSNGKTVVGAEAFTSEPESSRWQEYPFSLKALGDKMFCEGVNKMVIHRFVHQPNPSARPGMTMGPWGIHFDRTNTWFEQAGGWLRYMARCQVLLRQGLPVKDLLYFTGEEANVYTRVRTNELQPSPPAGYDYDLINAETLLQKTSLKDGRIHLSGGMQYRLLVLQDFKRLSLPLLKKLRSLVNDGMVLAGEKPVGPLGLLPAADKEEFHKIADELWGPLPEKDNGQLVVGEGRVISSLSLSFLLPSLAKGRDFTYTSRSGDAPILFTHRQFGNTDIYFVCNQRRSFEDVVCTFRVRGKQPEVWDATTGCILPQPFFAQEETATKVPLQLESYGAVFVVFRKTISGPNFLGLSSGETILLNTKHFENLSPKTFRDVHGNFTITLWAKPEMACMLRHSIHMGNVKHPYTNYYAIYPSAGRALYGEGHATCGLAIGRNGVAVWESAEYPVLALAAEMPLSGWSHVALVYENGVPSVYVNGALLKRGERAGLIIHPSLGDAQSQEEASPYNGDMTQPILYPHVLNENKIRELAAAGQSIQAGQAPFYELVMQRKKPALLLWQKGAYNLHLSNGGRQPFFVKGAGQLQIIAKGWRVYFPPGSGAPATIQLPRLISLHRHAQKGVSHFSGTATYRNRFSVAREYKSGNQLLLLDLGRVEVIAEVFVNGKNMGLLWKRPYRIDISNAVKKGVNDLEVHVTNLWPNRLIGDESLPNPDAFTTAGGNGFEHLAGSGFQSVIGNSILQLPEWFVKGEPKPNNGRIGFATWKHYTANDPLLESGLIGPVQLWIGEVVELKANAK
ncbi:glycosyl hydrolase family 43 [Flavisolibacter sp. BT320]|nr:glycosyl hydrolase family 43 [Flavisolibacter longurius]